MGTSRPVVQGTQEIVCGGHYLTCSAAMRMLLSGGNAFDAAAAAGFTAAVVEPLASYSLASEASFLLYHASSRRVQVLSGQGGAPGRATVELFKQKGLDKIPTGPGPNAELAFTVPGVVDALILMLQEYGTKTIDEAIAPAIEYAEHGFPMYEAMRRRLDPRQPFEGSFPEDAVQFMEQFRRYPPGGMDVFYPGGEPLEVGQLLVQKQLAATLKLLSTRESYASCHRDAGLQAARDTFYRGDIARTIVQCSERVGGLLTSEDLANYRAKFEEPLRTTYMGHEVCTQSTWTQGGVLLQALNLLEHFDLRAMGHNSPEYIHTVTEAIKLAFADRERYYGDPDFTSVPIDGLVSKDYAASRALRIRENGACEALPEAGDPWRFCAGTPPPISFAADAPDTTPVPGDRTPQDKDGTTHFAIVDRDGSMVCATPSGGAFGKSVFFPELGCALSTRSEIFFLDQQHPNGLHPGKRPRTTLVNYMVCRDGEPIMTLGCPGGDSQAQANLQLLLNVMVFGMNPQEAVEAPRFSSQSVTNSFYPRVYLRGQLDVEPGIPGNVRAKLAALGHKIAEAESCGMGAVVTQRDPQTGVVSAGADPRRTTYAIGW